MTAHSEKLQQLFDTMIIRNNIVSPRGNIVVANVPDVVKRKVEKMTTNRDRYAAIARRFPSPYVKWYLVACVHEMEAEQDFSKYLGNGQSLSKKTTIVPVGRGPFSTFEEGAVDALRLQKANDISDGNMGTLLNFLEGYNGYGYSKYHNINSPYLFSGSNHYTKGKYVSDGKWDANAVSSQVGIALLLQRIRQLSIC